MQLNLLIEKAALIAGSEYKVAKQLGIPQSHVWGWKNGTRTCAPEDRALLADIAGVDPYPEVIEAMIERWEGKPKGERLKEALLSRIASSGLNSSFAHRIRYALHKLLTKRAPSPVPQNAMHA